MKNWRLNIILIIVLIFGAGCIARLFYLQILNHKFYQAQALGQQAGFQEINGSRGQIFFVNSQESKGGSGTGETKSLAIDKDSFVISAMPNEIENEEIFAENLAKNISETKESVLAKLEGRTSYTIIKRGLAQEDVDKIKSLYLKVVDCNDIKIEKIYHPSYYVRMGKTISDYASHINNVLRFMEVF